MILNLLLACYSSFPEERASLYADNPYHDFDRDGLTENQGDCDDLDKSSKLPLEWFLDADGDGFGDDSEVIKACIPKANQEELIEILKDYVLVGGDCDDSDPTTNPHAQEFCNGQDSDCNTFVDDYAGPGAPEWYLDQDGDGQGRSDSVVLLCNKPDGYADNNTDCDDQNPNVYKNNKEVCDGIDNDCDGLVDGESAEGGQLWSPDFDEDGYPSSSTVIYSCEKPDSFFIAREEGILLDCDDSAASIYPNAAEICNGLDDNCDGLIDEAAIDMNSFYADVDGDGYGDINDTVSACSADAGWVSNSGDCNDNHPGINPAASEVCNGLDDDCNGQTDEQALNPSVYYVDSDGDGYGDTDQTYLACPSFDTGEALAPVGYASLSGDCNDQEPLIHPTADEWCTASVDENCDGHNTLGAVDYATYLADTDGDSFGNPDYLLEVCVHPVGYVEFIDTITTPYDCNDNDAEVFPGAIEVCNGKLDDCYHDDGILTPPQTELDTDGDGYVECDLGSLLPSQWADPDIGILGGLDCNEGDPFVYPDAEEICDGLFQNCSDPDILILPSPATEMDDDGDFFVECTDFDPNIWQGAPEVVAEGGGDDCDDTNPNTYPGSAYLTSTIECFRDDSGDGVADCLPDGNGVDTSCDPDASLDLYGVQVDFTEVLAGYYIKGSPAPGHVLGYEMGRKYNEYQYEVELTHDFYAMTTEVTQAMYEVIFGELWREEQVDFNGEGADIPVYYVNWPMVADFANQLTIRHNNVKGTSLSECYTCIDSGTLEVSCTQSMDPYTCDGYRMPTDAEWEYMARAVYTPSLPPNTEWPSTAFWADDGVGNIATGHKDNCADTSWMFEVSVLDTTQGAYTLGDYAWYCANTAVGQSYFTQEILQKLPNGFGLYDIYGNVAEWCHDYIAAETSNPNLPLQVDLLGDMEAGYHSVKGGAKHDPPRLLRAASQGARVENGRYPAVGMRLIRLAN